jgi:mitochondrial distribution and morphology protein 12
MSIDLDWSKLDASYASSLIDALNRQLQSTPRPSFIGPIEITSFEFGSQPPVVELVDLRDIYRDFLDDDEDDDVEGANNIDAAEGGSRFSAAAAGNRQDHDDHDREDDEFEWVSRRSARRGMAMDEAAAPMYYHHLPPHVRYARGPASEVVHHLQPSASSSFGEAPGSSGSVWNAGGMPARHSPDEHPTTFPLSASASASASFATAAEPPWREFRSTQQRIHSSSLHSTHRPTISTAAAPPSSSSLSPPPPHPDLADADMVAAVDPSPAAAAALKTTTAKLDTTGLAAAVAPTLGAAAADEHPNLQLHLLVSWHSDLRLTLTTSLRINYPSPLFMSLPIKLSVTGLVFDGELAVAYEGGRRVHLCVLDGLDPYGPSARRSAGSQGSTPSDPEGEDAHATKPLPVGQRLLPEIFIESELGQADKHVLKNVTRVEKFIQDVIRKTVEEELVFPNFHTLVLK